jgi:hypothetical protein
MQDLFLLQTVHLKLSKEDQANILKLLSRVKFL